MTLDGGLLSNRIDMRLPSQACSLAQALWQAWNGNSMGLILEARGPNLFPLPSLSQRLIFDFHIGSLIKVAGIAPSNGPDSNLFR